MIAASGEALQAACFKSWAEWVSKNREKNKKLRAVEKTLGASDEGLKLLVFSAWRTLAGTQARTARSKARTMNSAMKSINVGQELLMTQICMSWFRIIAAEKVGKLQLNVADAQAALDGAMETAKKAVEEDVGNHMKVVERLRGELETATKQLAEATGRCDSLEGQIEESDCALKAKEVHFQCLTVELEDSRRKARDIGDELSKVGIFLQSTSPNAKKNRPRSGAKAPEGALPKIGKEPGRPLSGTRSGNNSRPQSARLL
jgi:chromosome segregation ATPase